MINLTDKDLIAKKDALVTFLKYDLFKDIPQDTKNINLDSNQEFFDIPELEEILEDINNKNKLFIEQSNQKEKDQIISKNIEFTKREIIKLQNSILEISKKDDGGNEKEIQSINNKIADKQKYLDKLNHSDEVKIKKNRLLADLLFLQIDKNNNNKILNKFDISIKLPADIVYNENDIIKNIKNKIEKQETIAIAKEFNNFCKENKEISQYIELTNKINQLGKYIQKTEITITDIYEQIKLENDDGKLDKLQEEFKKLQEDIKQNEKNRISAIIERHLVQEQYKNVKDNNNISKQRQFNNIQINDFYLLNEYLIMLTKFSVDSFFLEEDLKNENIAKVITAIQEARGHSEDYLHYAVEKDQNNIMQNLISKIKENNIDTKKDNTKNILILNVFSTNDACNRCSHKMNDVLDIFTSQLQKIEELDNATAKLIYNSSKTMLYKNTNTDNKSYLQKSAGFSSSGSKSYHTVKKNNNAIDYQTLSDVKKIMDFEDFETKSFSSQSLKSETKYNAKINISDNYSYTTEKPSNKIKGNNKCSKVSSKSMTKE